MDPCPEAITFAFHALIDLMPGITVDTAGCDKQNVSRSGKCSRLPDQVADHRGNALGNLFLPIAAEVEVAEIAFGKTVSSVDAAGKRTFIQRHAGKHADVVF